MNEWIFLSHVLLSVGFVLGALRLGKEALIASIALQAVLANLFVLKQMTLFGMQVTCSDVYIIGSMLGLNLLQEYFGRSLVSKTIWISFFSMLLFGIMGQFQLFYAPSLFDSTHSSYVQLLDAQPRIVFASFTAYLLVQQLDMQLFGWLRKRFTALPLSVRSAISLLACQLCDTIIFAVLGLYGIVESVPDIILVSFAIKAIIICCTIPFTQLSRRIVRLEDEPAV